MMVSCDGPTASTDEAALGQRSGPTAVSSLAAIPVPDPPPAPARPPLVGRYRLDDCFDARAGVERFRATQFDEVGGKMAVVLIREPRPEPRATRPHPPRWPSLDWEDDVARRAQTAGLARIVDQFIDDNHAYLAVEFPSGLNLWDAWDDPAFSAGERFAWLIQLAELLKSLHRVGAVLESLSPAQVWVSPLGDLLLDPTVRLLPLPLPATAPIRPTFTSPPELLHGLTVDARSDLYCFGALLYALELGHELGDLDFHTPGAPKPFLERFPDSHPTIGRLISKTLQPDRGLRFPSSPITEDLSGFEELIQALGQAQRALDRARLDLAAWTNTGMVRQGNEDTFALVHATEAYEGNIEDYALVLVADGMGGSAAGEVAATLAVQTLRQHLMTDFPFCALFDEPGLMPVTIEQNLIVGRIEAALREANRRVYLEARLSDDRHGMGCTAEAVYVDGRQVVLGHVGDSRTYHLHHGRLVQLTRDQTVVEGLVAAGRVTAEEAETHPRRSELRQAIGGRSDVEPQFATVELVPGDWIVVCSDGLSGAVAPTEIHAILERATSAEQACRRLVNRANLAGAFDNITVAVVRAS
jgi:serine/threonine protein phosphatase PrpC